jgi:hypothetical protein
LGWPDKTVPTIADLARKRAREIISERDGELMFDARFTGGEDLLIRSSKLLQKNFRSITDLSLEAWDPLFQAVEAVFVDLLRQCGARTSS